MGLPELIVTVRYESYSSIKVKSTNTLVKSKVALAWGGHSYPLPNLRGLNRECQIAESGRVGASFVSLEPLKDTMN